MNVRLPNFSPMCQRCHEENEYDMHCLFFCPTSRHVWFASALGLRALDLPLNMDATIQHVTGKLDQEGIKLFVYTMWEIWKERNKAVIEHSQFQPQAVLKRVTASIRSEQSITNISVIQGGIPVDKHEVYNQGWQVLMDASWVNTNCAGGAYIVYDKGNIHSIGLHYFRAQDAFLAETMVLQEAVNYVYDHLGITGQTKVQFFSDCLNLVDVVNQSGTLEIPSWIARELVQHIIDKIEAFQPDATVHYVGRQAVQRAHVLANVARRRNLSYRGQPDMMLQQEGCMNTRIDECYFQQVEEAPP